MGADIRPSRQLLVIAGVLVAAVLAAAAVAMRSSCRAVDIGFWLSPIAYDLGVRGGPLTNADLDTLARTARAEIQTAFAGLAIHVTDNGEAARHVHVVQELRDLRFRRQVLIPAQSRAVAGLGGHGAVSFSWLAESAIAHASPDTSRPELLAAIGRGIGRAAVHEFVHILLPRAPIHDSDDVGSYEYRSAARREQYFGQMNWDVAEPMLKTRFGRCG